MKIEYEVKGIILDCHELSDIHHYYEAACTAEYILENQLYNITDEDTAMCVGYETRRLMDKYGYDEEEAISEAVGNIA